eukprot:9506363-Lingulodinium_polyedra.AAC.1
MGAQRTAPRVTGGTVRSYRASRTQGLSSSRTDWRSPRQGCHQVASGRCKSLPAASAAWGHT